MSTAEAVRPTEPSRAVFVDVGEAAGALVVSPPAACEGLEVEICPVGEPDARTHVWILPRLAGGRITHAGVFPSLPVGCYRVFRPDGSPGDVVEVQAATVTQISW